MDTKEKAYKQRTREEIIAWWRQAKERKEAFQKETNEWWQSRQKGLKAAEEVRDTGHRCEVGRP